MPFFRLRSGFVLLLLSESAWTVATGCGDDAAASSRPVAVADVRISPPPPSPAPRDAGGVALTDADEGFGAKGYVTTSMKESWDVVGGAARQPDGKIVVAGHSLAGFDVIVGRFDANGA